jgi:hypothetical protein
MIYVALFHSMRMVYSNSSGMISSTSTLATEPFSIAIRNRPRVPLYPELSLRLHT